MRPELRVPRAWKRPRTTTSASYFYASSRTSTGIVPHGSHDRRLPRPGRVGL